MTTTMSRSTWVVVSQQVESTSSRGCQPTSSTTRSGAAQGSCPVSWLVGVWAVGSAGQGSGTSPTEVAGSVSVSIQIRVPRRPRRHPACVPSPTVEAAASPDHTGDAASMMRTVAPVAAAASAIASTTVEAPAPELAAVTRTSGGYPAEASAGSLGSPDLGRDVSSSASDGEQRSGFRWHPSRSPALVDWRIPRWRLLVSMPTSGRVLVPGDGAVAASWSSRVEMGREA